MAFSQDGVFRILDDGHEALQIRIDLINRARKTIDLSYFIFANDRTAQTGLALLRNARRRGIKVRILADSSFNKIPSDIRAALLGEGVEILEYHKFSWKNPLLLLRRMHDKMLIVDGQHMILGGRNVENTYFGLNPDARTNRVDRDAYVTGGAVKDALKYFDELCSTDHVTRLKMTEAEIIQSAAQGKDKLDESLRSLTTDQNFLLDSNRDWTAGEELHSNIRFLSNDIRMGRHHEATFTKELINMVKNAKESVIIESPYLVPTRRFKRIFRDAIRRGVQVRILTNSTYSNDGLLPAAGYARYRKELAEMGIEIWEYGGPEALHSKSAVMDGKTAIVSTYNLDPRSAYINTEVAVAVDSPSKSAELRRSMDRNLERAWKIGIDGRPIGFSSAHPKASLKKRIAVECLRWSLIPVIKNQL